MTGITVITVARKPLSEGSVAENVLKWETGGLNIEASRLSCDDHPGVHKREGDVFSPTLKGKAKTKDSGIYHTPEGRWPPNLVLAHLPGCQNEGCATGCPVPELDEQSFKAGIHSAGTARQKKVHSSYQASSYHAPVERQMNRLGDSGGAARFFKQVKADVDPHEKGVGLEQTDQDERTDEQG